ncbi:MAG: redoxin domain-containing protein [Gammaproteobacteria bacterium]|nr:redoxin domain-containing protein [Gammaproteobacteria bacterium]
MERTRVPEIPDGLQWFNVDSPVSLLDQAGRVVLLDFGNYSSIHCRHVVSDLRYLADKYRDRLVIIGIHSPAFPGEKDGAHVQKAINRHRINYPVVHDPGLTISMVYGVRVWPTQVLIDPEGYILGSLSGEVRLSELEQLIDYQANRKGGSPVAGGSSFTILQSPEPAGVLSFPGRIVASDSKVYIADSGNNRILVASNSGSVLRQYGGETAGLIDGDGGSAAFNNPQGMVLVDEHLYIADEGNHAIRRINIRNNDVVTVAGTGRQGSSAVIDGSDPLNVDLNSPCDLAFKSGVLYIAMAGLHQIWRFSLVKNTLEVFSGSGEENLVNGPPGEAAFAQPSSLTILGDKLYTADAVTSAVRSVDLATGFVSALVGAGSVEYGENDGDGVATRLQYPLDIEADPARNLLWVADTYNNKIRRISVSDKYVSSVFLNRALDEPGGLAFRNDTLYIANTNLHEILRLNPENGHAEALNVTEEFAEI